MSNKPNATPVGVTIFQHGKTNKSGMAGACKSDRLFVAWLIETFGHRNLCKGNIVSISQATNNRSLLHTPAKKVLE
jgi:hypothetical protein